MRDITVRGNSLSGEKMEKQNKRLEKKSRFI